MTGPTPETCIAPSRGERELLEQIARKATATKRDVQRARIILLAVAGWSNAAIAREVGCVRNTVRTWRKRFAREGKEGLKDRPRPGRPPTYDERARVLVKSIACQRPADLGLPLGRLSVPVIREEAAKFLDPCPSETTIGEWLREDSIKPWRYRMWITPRDPSFMKKAGPVLDLYQGMWKGMPLGPRDHVLCADEKTCIQVLRRLVPVSPPRPGLPGRVEHGYERKGVLVYQAFLDVRTGRVMGRCAPRNTAKSFRKLVRKVMRKEPYRSARTVFLVLDNGSAHLPKIFPTWLKEDFPKAVPAFLPVHGSWLNQVEIYNSILGKKVLTPNDFSNREDLERRIVGFERRYNKTARPFHWKFTRKDLRELLRRLGPQD